jgi:cation diffusion facilitator CzcD-associated flavoprotein CzcO
MRKQVKDPVLRRKLTPDYKPGCKRILLSNDYLPSLAQPNVDVVTDGVQEIRANSIVGADGVEREVDAIIMGTGFQVTDLPIADRIRGADGRSLGEHWGDGGLQAHRGTTVTGFPNLFFLLGPNTGLGHTSVVVMAEAQVGYVRQALDHMDRTRARAVEPRAEVMAAWNRDVQRRMKGTVWTEGGCASWYLDENGRNTTLWPDFSYRFVQALRHFDAGEYVAQPSAVPAAPLRRRLLDPA